MEILIKISQVIAIIGGLLKFMEMEKYNRLGFAIIYLILTLIISANL